MSSLNIDATSTDLETAKKKAKVTDNVGDDVARPKQQSSLLTFFSSSPKTKDERSHGSGDIVSPGKTIASSAVESNDKTSSDGNETVDVDTGKTKAIVPKIVSSSATWQSLNDNFVLVRKPRRPKNKFNGSGNDEPPRTSVASFDLDGTLVRWSSDSSGFWPSKLEHYELWNTNVIAKMRHLYDENHLLVVFTNQGGIQGAHSGKKASLIKSILDWLEFLIQRPLIAIASTKSTKKYRDRSFHKPLPSMWQKVLVPYFAKKSAPFDVSTSFFVGDSADESDPQGGVDKKFAESLGLAFYEPHEYFGASNQELRQRKQLLDQQFDCKGKDGVLPITPLAALEARNALIGGYYSLRSQGPILMLLVGVQGSGKSTFSRLVLFGKTESQNDKLDSRNNGWVWLSQDTINNGKPGKREAVWRESRKAILGGRSVIIDRMHLDPAERQSTIENVANAVEDISVNVHVVLLNPPKEIICRRIKTRTNHPGKVEGDMGVRLASNSINRLVVPTYKEQPQPQLISCVTTEFAARQLALRYHHTAIANCEGFSTSFQSVHSVPFASALSSTQNSLTSSLSIPSITLGTMKIGRRGCNETVQKMIMAGFRSIDTAPTYKNEDKVGEALEALNAINNSNDVFIIAKVPKRATESHQVESEFQMVLQNLNPNCVDLLLLHWPSDVIAQNTLKDVWDCMESLVKEGKCKALGVCNFNEKALAILLKCCTIPPILNQVERHPLLPQHALVDFCARNNILIQAHTALGQGRDELLQNPTIKNIAKETTLTPAQVVIQWNLQHGVLVVTKCSREAHAKEILSIVSSSGTKAFLSPKHMSALDKLGNNTRFVAPPFMYGSQATYCWGEQMPRI